MINKYNLYNLYSNMKASTFLKMERYKIKDMYLLDMLEKANEPINNDSISEMIDFMIFISEVNNNE